MRTITLSVVVTYDERITSEADVRRVAEWIFTDHLLPWVPPNVEVELITSQKEQP